MNLIRSSHEIRINAPASTTSPQEIQAWQSSMSDSGWRVLTDFRNWSNWNPSIQSVKQEGQEPPARGTLLRVVSGGTDRACSIDSWDPPQSIQFSIDLIGGEIAYGFHIQTNSKEAEIHLSLKLERSLSGFARIFALFLKWRLQSLGSQVLTNLATRMRSTRSL